MESASAFGAPGMEPRWTRSAKEGIGTAYHTSCRVWFTLSHGIINEIYYPNVDCPNTRDFQFLISDGETFCHEERRDLLHEIEYPEKGALYYRLTNSDPKGRYWIVKDVITDPHSSVLLMRTKLVVNDKDLEGKLKVYALMAPHMKGLGQHNSAWCDEIDGRPLFHAARAESHMTFGGSPQFTRRSVGFVGFSDGWQDLMDNFKMDWEFTRAEDGNIALTGEIDLSCGPEFVLAVAFGRSAQSASSKLVQSLAIPFQQQLDTYVKQWKRVGRQEDRTSDLGRREIPPRKDKPATEPDADVAGHTGDAGWLYNLSRLVLLAHEDKVFPGALVASMSIPWGETKGDADLGGYHLVWPRDMVKSATALLASGQTATPLRSLIWLACLQDTDGAVPQNSWIDGQPYWKGRQLDEVAAPILLAWRLKQANALGLFDPVPMILRAANYLVLHGPVTGQERWEENSGYSPSTLATIVAALVCAADLISASRREASRFLLEHADWISAHIEDWTVATKGDLVPGLPRHYIRINPADPAQPGIIPDPNTAMVQIANGGGLHPARNVVSLEFLDLVRLGLRDPMDGLMKDSVAVIDAVLKHDLPQGPAWRRYNYDGYGPKDDGSAFDGAGTGRSWPLLSGERGHYELAAGRDPLPCLKALENFANEGGMLPEQVWDGPDLPQARMFRGVQAGSAMPLCWAHGEYISLVKSRQTKQVIDVIPAVYERYVRKKQSNDFEIWTLAHQTPEIPGGKTLRIVTSEPATIRWTSDNGQTTKEAASADSKIGCFFADVPLAGISAGTEVQFTLRGFPDTPAQPFRVKIK
jgi:glucoamylase